jgi:4-diphosphocytidyl-2-C-methyl-D-erythritol kinase
VLTYFPLRIPYTILLCHPNIHVSTGWAYHQITPQAVGAPPDLQALLVEGMANPGILREGLRNDFENPVFSRFPAIREIKETMNREGAVFALMSGSGSSVYGFFADETRASTAARLCHDRGYRTFLTEPFFSLP